MLNSIQCNEMIYLASKANSDCMAMPLQLHAYLVHCISHLFHMNASKFL